MEWIDGRIPRFHPLFTKHDGIVAWWICDGHADTEHSLAKPHFEEPCVDRDETLELCAILNEEDEQATGVKYVGDRQV